MKKTGDVSPSDTHVVLVGCTTEVHYQSTASCTSNNPSSKTHMECCSDYKSMYMSNTICDFVNRIIWRCMYVMCSFIGLFVFKRCSYSRYPIYVLKCNWVMYVCMGGKYMLRENNTAVAVMKSYQHYSLLDSVQHFTIIRKEVIYVCIIHIWLYYRSVPKW